MKPNSISGMMTVTLLTLAIPSFAAFDDDAERRSEPSLLSMRVAIEEAKSGYERGVIEFDRELYGGPVVDFSKHIADVSCLREPGEDAPYDVFIFLNKAGGEKLKTLTREALKQRIEIQVNGEPVGHTKIEVTHELVDFRGEKRGLITFGVGSDQEKGKAIAKTLMSQRDMNKSSK